MEERRYFSEAARKNSEGAMKTIAERMALNITAEEAIRQMLITSKALDYLEKEKTEETSHIKR